MVLAFMGMMVNSAIAQTVYWTKETVPFIERVNIHMSPAPLNEKISKRRLDTYTRNYHPAAQFVSKTLESGTRVLLNLREVITLDVSHYEVAKGPHAIPKLLQITSQDLVPVVSLSPLDGRKSFGFIRVKDLKRLVADCTGALTPVADILNHPSPYTIIYALCPADRRELCALIIKHQGKWVLDPETGKPAVFWGVAQSRREKEVDKTISRRLWPETDTPQGVYGVYATMKDKDLKYGRAPRIDLDLSGSDIIVPPLNGHSYNIYSGILDGILPAAAQQEYRFNEFALAYAVGGRYAMRIHDDSRHPDFPREYLTPTTHWRIRRTAGCINMGKGMHKLLKVLQDLKVNDGSEQKRVTVLADGQQVSWNALPGLGRTFLVVLDVKDPHLILKAHVKPQDEEDDEEDEE